MRPSRLGVAEDPVDCDIDGDGSNNFLLVPRAVTSEFMPLINKL